MRRAVDVGGCSTLNGDGCANFCSVDAPNLDRAGFPRSDDPQPTNAIRATAERDGMRRFLRPTSLPTQHEKLNFSDWRTYDNQKSRGAKDIEPALESGSMPPGETARRSITRPDYATSRSKHC
jgi:hypothetical protein